MTAPVYTFTMGMSNLPLPAQERGFEMEYFPIGVSGRTYDGSYRAQHIANKWRVRVTWEGLTAAERATVWAAYGGYIVTACTVTLPNGMSFSGFVDMGSWSEAVWYDPHRNRQLYNVSFVIVEA